jgi:hypothetical protein
MSSFLRGAGLGMLFLAALAALTLFKPNIALVGALLAAHLGVRHGPRLFAAAAIPTAGVAARLLVLPCLNFGSWTVWREWYDFVYRADPHMLVRSVGAGNFSTPLLVWSRVGVDVYTVSLALLGPLVILLIVASWWPKPAGASAASSPGQATRAAVTRVLEDAHLTLGIGVVLTKSDPAFRPSTFRSFVCLLPPTERPWPGGVGLTRPVPGTRERAQRTPPEPSRKRTTRRPSRGRATPPYPSRPRPRFRRGVESERPKNLGPEGCRARIRALVTNPGEL